MFGIPNSLSITPNKPKLPTANIGLLLLSQSSEFRERVSIRSVLWTVGPLGVTDLVCKGWGSEIDSTSNGFNKGIDPVARKLTLTTLPCVVDSGRRHRAHG